MKHVMMIDAPETCGDCRFNDCRPYKGIVLCYRFNKGVKENTRPAECIALDVEVDDVTK